MYYKHLHFLSHFSTIHPFHIPSLLHPFCPPIPFTSFSFLLSSNSLHLLLLPSPSIPLPWCLQIHPQGSERGTADAGRTEQEVPRQGKLKHFQPNRLYITQSVEDFLNGYPILPSLPKLLLRGGVYRPFVLVVHTVMVTSNWNPMHSAIVSWKIKTKLHHALGSRCCCQGGKPTQKGRYRRVIMAFAVEPHSHCLQCRRFTLWCSQVPLAVVLADIAECGIL